MDELNVNQMQTERKPTVNVPLLAKWTNILFWLIIVSTVANMLTSENVTNAVPLLAFAGQILNIAATAAYGVVLMKIASESMHYRNSAICCFITAVISVAVIPISDDTESFIAISVVIVSVVINMIGEYYEFMGHTDVLRDVDRTLSDKWFKLWKWYVGYIFRNDRRNSTCRDNTADRNDYSSGLYYRNAGRKHSEDCVYL